MPMQDPTKAGSFDVATLSASINIMPNMYGRLGAMGLFAPKPISTRTALIESKSGVLSLVPSLPPGSPGTPNKMGGRNVKSFVVPHLPMEDTILPEAYQGVRQFGSETALTPLQSAVNDSLQAMKNKIEITREYLRVGALSGVIKDASGATLYSLFTEFSVTQKTVDFVLGTGTTDVKAKCLEVVRHIEDNLLGDVTSGIRCEVSPEFFDKLTSHANVEAAYANWQAAQERLGGDMRNGFSFGGITFVEYRAASTDTSGATVKFIPAGDGLAYPLGTRESFIEIFAPAPYNETVNTNGQPYYAKMEERKFGKGYDLEAQSNPLPLCLRPGVLIRCYSSN